MTFWGARFFAERLFLCLVMLELMRWFPLLLLFLFTASCQVAKRKWDDGSDRLEKSARAFELGEGEDVEEDEEDDREDDEVTRSLRKQEEEAENRRRQEIYRGQENWADDFR